MGLVFLITILVWLYWYERGLSEVSSAAHFQQDETLTPTPTPTPPASTAQKVIHDLDNMPKAPKKEPTELPPIQSQGRKKRPLNIKDKVRAMAAKYNLDTFIVHHHESGASRLGGASPELLDPPTLPRLEKFPIRAKDMIKLPKRKFKETPKIQAESLRSSHSLLSSEQDRARIEHAEAVKRVFLTSWNQYKKYAWGYDEVKPLTNEAVSPFAGWAATMVDALDTLYIMGLHEEFEEAVKYVGTIDFTRTFRQEIPLFETVIRYLGGLLSAYDLSGHKHSILLQKAEELAENLMGAFDTPNRMPITFFWWQDEMTKVRFTASGDTVAAEVGSMSVEFTRLAQLTGKNKYYDAVARITDQLYEYLMNTSEIKGLLPKMLDISGCDLIDYTLDTEEPVSGAEDAPPKISATSDDQALSATLKINPILGRCTPQGFSHGAKKHTRTYTLGGMTDSVYEYFIKEYLLIGGAEQKYVDLYHAMTESTVEHLVYRPVLRFPKDNSEPQTVAGSAKDPFFKDLLLLGTTMNNPRSGGFGFDSEMEHLACYAGGMFALAGRVLNRPEDVELGARLTKGCIWAYQETRSGVMPETFRAQVCDNVDPSMRCMATEEAEQQVRKRPGISPIDNKYILRPEAIESVFYMYRVTGDPVWLEHGWNMFSSIEKLTRMVDDSGNVIAYAAAQRVETKYDPISNLNLRNEAESFWLGETLKYAYLLFADPSVVSLDEYVFNTEAHPFRLSN